MLLKNIPLTIKETQEGLLNNKFKAVDLVDTYFERIKLRNKDINAVITKTEDVAYEKAKKIDGIIKDKGKDSLKEYPLLGVSVIHKDLFITKNILTTAGSNVLKNYYPDYDSTIVKILNEAGCILLGKANCDAWAHGASGENSDFGVTKNPWNEEYVPGGSSSGSAASLADNMCLIATGTDTGGSVRQPANFCGLYGFKPSYGVVSRYGVIAMSSSLDCVGHFSRNAYDIEKVFNVTKGKDGMDDTLLDIDNLTFTSNQKENKDIVIGIPKEYISGDLDKDVKQNLEKAIDNFKKLDIKFKEISLKHTKYAIDVYYIIQPSEVSSNLARFDGVRYGENRNEFGDEAKRRIMLGNYVLSSGYYDDYYIKAQKVRSLLINDFKNSFSEVDAIISPVAPSKAFKLGQKVNDPLKMYLSDIYTVSANLTGIPALAIPYGFSDSNLPLGFQIMAPKYNDGLLFKLAKMFEDVTNYSPKVV